MPKSSLNRNRFLWLAAALVLACVVGIAAYTFSRPAPSDVKSQETPRPKASEGAATLPSNPSSTPQPISPNPSPQSNAQGTITISSPTQGSSVSSGTKVAGTAAANHGKLYYRLKGGKSGQLALGNTEAGPGGTGNVPFSFELAFTNQVASGGDQGVLEVFTMGTDGTEQAAASVTVNIQP